MKTNAGYNRARRAAAGGLVTVFLFCLIALPVSASVNALRNAFNPRGFFVTLKSTDQPEWLRSSFETGFYRAGEGGQGGGGGGNGSNESKDDLGHSNIVYSEAENGLDYADAADVDTIYSTYDHNPTPGKNFMIGYSKNEQAASLEAIPDFTSYIGTPARGSQTLQDPSGGQWWTIPIHLTLGEEQEDGTRNAMEPGTLYEFAYLRGNQANNGTTCVLMPGDEPGTYKGYLYNPNSFTEEERAIYEAHKYDEYEFITAIYPEGTSSDNTVDHTIESVPMRYRIQTYADLKTWTESGERTEAEAFLSAVSESDYASGKYVRENVAALKSTLEELDEEAQASVKYQLQKDAEWTIQQMIGDLKAALETAKQSRPVVNFEDYEKALSNAETVYADVKDKTGTTVDQYLPEPVDALKQAIDHAKSTIMANSSQAEVDAETAALEEAAMNALDALVRPAEEVIFTDPATGVTVTADASSITANTRLVVREVVSGTTEYTEMVARVSPAPDAVAIYRILFYDGVDVVHPTKPVTVQIPLQNRFEQTAPSVYYLDDAGSPGVAVNATAPEGYRIFETSDLGTFVMAGQKQSEPEQPTTPEEPTSSNQEEPTSGKQEEPTSGNNSQEPSSQIVNPTQAPTASPSNEAPSNQNNNAQPSSSTTAKNQQNPATTQPPTHTTTRTTTRSTASRTTRIIRSTRNTQNDQRTQNEMTRTSVLQTQAVQPTTRTTTTTSPTTAKDTSDLEQDANQNTLLFIALGIAAVGLGAAGYEYAKDQKDGNGTDEDL